MDTYLLEFERWLVGTPAEKAAWRAELASHLEEAADTNDLQAAIARLGSPREAAATFTQGRRRDPAPLVPRLAAAAIDYAPLVLVSVLVGLRALSRSQSAFAIGVPTSVSFGDGRTVGEALAVAAAVAWSVFGLAFVESRRGQTFGKRAFALWTSSQDGTATSFGQGALRRIPVFFGPLVLVELVYLGCRGGGRRLFDVVARTEVVVAPADTASLTAHEPPVVDDTAVSHEYGAGPLRR